MKGRGKLSLEIQEDLHHIKINVTDTGSGIPKRSFIVFLKLVLQQKEEVGD